MFNNSNKPNNGYRGGSRGGGSQSRDSRGGSFSSRGSFGGNRRGGGGNRRFGRRGDDVLDYSKYVKKAEPKIIEDYKSAHKFVDFNVDDAIKKNIAEKKYILPTPIQDQIIDHIIDGKDVIGIANTGTGKTAAFLIPLINKVILNRKEKVLILVPTRELANQIYDEFVTFAKGISIGATTVIGGESIYNQINDLRRNPHFVIGTPGRIQDLENRGVLDFGKFHNIVLDEVDRMVDMGFIDDIKHILSKIPGDRQSLFFSATMSREIETLVKSFLRNPIMVSVKTKPTSENVNQDIVKVQSREDKIEKLHSILILETVTKTIVFVKTKMEADRLEGELFTRGFKTTALHGDKTQFSRQKSLNKFKQGLVDVLVATDVAARGLDIPDVSHVINYDLPENYDDYVHRIGRTGRGNKTGTALTFVK